MPLTLTPQAISRFWAKVRFSANCWEWTGLREPYGYGLVKTASKGYRAHRVSWEICNGPIPQDLVVCHRCDNPPCVRPDHLFLGTRADNNRDRDQKGRHRPLTSEQQGKVRHPRGTEHWTHRNPDRVRRGEHHHAAKLTVDQVQEMRRLHAGGRSERMIAVEFGITHGNAHFILSRQTWKHIA